MISNWSINSILLHKKRSWKPSVFIEDYAFAAKGLVFHIGENTGLLKNKLHKLRIEFNVVPPTKVKKLAVGKGNAKKDDLYKQFESETSLNLLELFQLSKMDANPISDIVDSYFICKYGFELTQERH